MVDKSFILMSLKEDKVKKMTQVLNNDTCRKILEYLSKHERATATEISKELDMAMSTVHYNLKQLKENNLVTSDEYHYSEKGKEVIHYGLANKYIIIAPKEDKGFLDKLKGFLPIALISAGVGGLIYFFETNFDKLAALMPWFSQAKFSAAENVSPLMRVESDFAEPMMVMNDVVVAEPTSGMLIAPWFLIGAAFAIVLMIAYKFSKKNK